MWILLILILFCDSLKAQKLFAEQLFSGSREIPDDTRRITLIERLGDSRSQVEVIPEVDEDKVRCIPKTIFVEEIQYERGRNCHHTVGKKCHITYTTDYTSTTEKKCKTEFKKNCFINFISVVKICHTPLVRKCNDEVEGPEVCTTQYENHCETKFKTYILDQDEPVCEMKEEVRCMNMTVELHHIFDEQHNKKNEDRRGDVDSDVTPPNVIKEKCEKWPVQSCKLETKTITKVHPETSCSKVPKKICVPSNCKMFPGEEICNQETRTQVQNIPEEACDLEPHENCQMESSLVPRLVPQQNCIKVPKEVCVNTKKNPTKVKKPITKQWCFDPKEYEAKVDD
ncbi:uncharacterized protein [Lepeophtheirus salmonis]|uniref:uncharacterized protein isoform X2 n=1 Tax=Lepeophtheirus salmonis TaxID=72036 RepID=UPI003AF38FB7